MILGYARVSTADQNSNLQTDALKKAGCENIFIDSISGTRDQRPELSKLLSTVRAGDCVVVWKLDRLGRSLAHLVKLVNQFKEQSVDLVFIVDSIDTTTPAGEFFFHVMAAMAQFERETIVQRTRAGLQAAKERGVKLGRPSKLSPHQKRAALKMIKDGEPYKTVALTFNITLASLYRIFPRGEV